MNIRLIAASLILCAGTAFAFVPPTDATGQCAGREGSGHQGTRERGRGRTSGDGQGAWGRDTRRASRRSRWRRRRCRRSRSSARRRSFWQRCSAQHARATACRTGEAPTVDGARAAELRIVLQPPYVSSTPASTPAERTKANEAPRRRVCSAVHRGLNHPAMLDHVKSGKGDRVILGFANLQPDAIQAGESAGQCRAAACS